MRKKQMKEIKDIKEIQVCVKMETSKVEEIDLYSKKMKLTRAHLVRNLIDAGLDDLKVMNNTGILSMAVKGIDLLGIVKNSLSERRYVLNDENKLIIDL